MDVDQEASAPRTVGRNEKKYQKFLDDYLGPATGILILILCLFVYHFSLADSEKIADHLAMNQDEQDLIIPPLASLMDKQGWSEETRNKILQSGDLVGLTLGLAAYGTRVVGALQELKGSMQHESRANAGQQAAQNGANGANGNGHIQLGSAFAGLSNFRAD